MAHLWQWVCYINDIKSSWGRKNMRKELLNGLTEDQIAKVKACDDIHDLLQLVEDEEVTLTSEQLAAVNGGGCSDSGDEKKTNDKVTANTKNKF